MTAQPVTSKPSPIAPTPWWWWDFVPWTVSPAARWASEPSAEADVVVGVVERPERTAVIGWPWLSGRCCSSVPPRAMFISCMPRQMPSSGRSRSSARRVSASSKASRSGTIPFVSGWASAP